MTTNIYDTANQLERDLRELPAYQQLKEAYQKLQEDEASRELFAEFRQQSTDLYEKQQNGEAIDPSMTEKLQSLSQQLTEKPVFMELVQAEQQVSQVIGDINRIITKPLEEVYQS